MDITLTQMHQNITCELIHARAMALSVSQRVNIIEEIDRAVINENMRIGEARISILPLPVVVEQKMIEYLSRKLDLFIELLVRTEKFALTSEGKCIFDRLYFSLSEGGKRLVDQCNYESDFSLQSRHRRVDGFFDYISGGGGIIEVNQAAPLATHFYDSSQRILSSILRSLGIDYQPKLTAPHLLEWFISEFRTRFGKKFPKRIALVIEHGYPPKFTDLPGVAADCMKIAREKYDEELEIVTCFPYEITLSGKKIMLGDLEIDMIWRNSVYMDDYRQQGLPIGDYEYILSNTNDFLVVNSTRSWLTRTKEFFALFAQDELFFKLGFTPLEAAILSEIIPLTVNTGANPEYFEKIADEKDEWISKPTDSGFGKGVVFGLSLTRDEWKRLIEERSTAGFVFQKRLGSTVINTLNITKDGSIEEISVEYDYCPHHINGHFPGTALLRALVKSKSNTDFSAMNLAGGGFILPAAFV